MKERIKIIVTLLVLLLIAFTFISLGQNTKDKMVICHIPPGNPDNAHTIEISKSAWKAHKEHGDSMGACDQDDWDKQEKITICHNGDDGSEIITISKSAWDAHEAHGDTIGECSTDDNDNGDDDDNDDGGNGDDDNDDDGDDGGDDDDGDDGGDDDDGDDGGDDDNDDIDVTPSNSNQLFVPTVFNTESINPENRVVKVYGNDISTENFTFRIYNRWGITVYSTNSFYVANQNGWDGIHNGKEVAIGVYTYVVSGQFLNGEPFEKTGTITFVK